VAPTRRTRAARRNGRPPWWTIAVLVLASITLITLDYRGGLNGGIGGARRVAHDLFSPVQRGVDDLLRPVGSFLGGMVHAGSLSAQNTRLRQQLEQAQRQALAQRTAARTLQQLTDLEKLEGLPSLSTIPAVTAQVTALNSSQFADTVDLDRGTSSGIDVGMPVVGGAGLVGRVVDAWSNGCTVRLLTDTNSTVSVAFAVAGSTAQNLALVTGRGHGSPVEVDYVEPGTQLTRGTVLTTTGLQHDLFPPGIPVATVTSATSSASATQETVTAATTADLSQLQFVAVLQWQAQVIPAGSS
jgi:rod shape-determining protein MreC